MRSELEQVMIVTGSDSPYFLSTCILLQSLARQHFPAQVRVLDFGLSGNERAFLERKKVFLEMPASLRAVASPGHPYVLKAKLIAYLIGLEVDSTILWVDSDIIVSRRFTLLLDDLLHQMRDHQSVLAAAPEMKIRDVFSNFPALDLTPFRRQIVQHGISTDADYFNSGLIIFRSTAPLLRWQELAVTVPFHSLFDQNIFNIVAHTTENVTKLPRQIWNFYAEDFDDPGSLPHSLDAPQDQAPAVIHLTSHRAGHLEYLPCAFSENTGGRWIRLLRDPGFRQFQFELLAEFMEENARDLEASGFWKPLV